MDLLVKLYALPQITSHHAEGISVRRAFAAEKHLVIEFVGRNFIPAWASECEISFARLPVACFLATSARTICGFACYDASARGFFGPVGIAEDWRGRGIGGELLIAALQDMRAQGYAYAIIGDVSDKKFYERLNPIEIDGSSPGFYAEMIRQSGSERS